MKEFIEKLYDKFEEKYRESESCNKYERVFRRGAFKEAIAIVSELAEEYKSKDCSECSRRKFYQQGYEDAKKEYINTSTDTSSDTSTTNTEWKQHILNRFEGDRL